MPSHRSVASNTAASGTSIVVTAPSGVTDGDTLYLSIASRHASACTLTIPSGFELVQGGDGTATIGAVYKKTASSEPANYTVTFSQTIVCGTVAVVAAQPTGSETVYQSDSTRNTTGSGSTSTTGSALTTTSATSLLYHFVLVTAASSTTRTHTPPSGMTEQLDTGIAGTSSWSGIMVSSEAYTGGPGSTGTRTGTLSSVAVFTVVTVSLDPLGGVDSLFTGNNF